MLLREMFIKEQGADAAIIFGRFNPPHFGHVSAWKEAAKFPIWYVGTNKSTIGPKDPLPYDVKIKVMETLYPNIKGHLVAEQSWFTLAAMVYEKHGSVTLHIVTDESDSTTYVAMLQKHNGKEGKHGFYEFKNIIWQPAPRLSSATDLRAAVANNDPIAFGKAAGVAANTKIGGVPFFDLVKQYLDAQATTVKKVAERIAYEPDEKGLQHMALSMPQNTLVIDTPGDLDWYKMGHDIANLELADPHEYGQSDSDMVIVSPSKEEMQKLMKQLDRLGLKYKLIGGTSDQPEIHGEKPSGLTERIVKVGSKFRLVSKKSGKNLGTYDTKEEAEKRERQVQYFKHMNETGGVGVVANNSQQAKDPRYVMSMTSDIKPGETQRQAKKMGFKLDKKGIPPLMHNTAAKNTSPNKAYNLGLAENKRFARKK